MAGRELGSDGRAHFDLDSLDSYAVTPDDPGRTTPNPAKKIAAAAAGTARKALADAEAECPDRKPKAIGIPVPSGTSHGESQGSPRGP